MKRLSPNELFHTNRTGSLNVLLLKSPASKDVDERLYDLEVILIDLQCNAVQMRLYEK